MAMLRGRPCPPGGHTLEGTGEPPEEATGDRMRQACPRPGGGERDALRHGQGDGIGACETAKQ